MFTPRTSKKDDDNTDHSKPDPTADSPLSRIEFTEPFERALRLMEETHRHVFVTGRAGTGKSTLLNYFKASTAKQVAVLAPTGVAALNVGGQTIHSFFRFKPDVTPESARKRIRGEGAEIYRKLDAIVIDEVSMVRADLLDCVDAFLRLNGPEADAPFGGLQMIFIGDLYQLPPVVSSAEKMLFKTLYPSPYFFSALAFQGLEMEFVELEKIYRQQDGRFIDLLNAIRNRTVTEEDLELLNSRLDSGLRAPCRRVLHPPHQHERPGRPLQRGAAQEAQRQDLDLDGNPRGRIRQGISPDGGGAEAQERAPRS